MHRARMTRKSTASDRGAAAVEFALLLPLILVLVLGIIDFGGMLHAQVTLTQAAREGARVAALQDDSDPAYDPNDVRNRTWGAIVSPLLKDDSKFNFEAQTCPSESDPSDAVVTAGYDFEFITPVGALITAFGGEGFDSSMPLSATGVMPCET